MKFLAQSADKLYNWIMRKIRIVGNKQGQIKAYLDDQEISVHQAIALLVQETGGRFESNEDEVLDAEIVG